MEEGRTADAPVEDRRQTVSDERKSGGQTAGGRNEDYSSDPRGSCSHCSWKHRHSSGETQIQLRSVRSKEHPRFTSREAASAETGLISSSNIHFLPLNVHRSEKSDI